MVSRIGYEMEEAIARNDIDKVRELLNNYEFDINRRNPRSGGTYLMSATYYGNIDIIKELLMAGADPNIQNWDRNTALFFAIARNNLEAAKRLLSSGADPDIPEGNRNLIQAVELGNQEMIDLLLQSGATIFSSYSRTLAPYQWRQILKNVNMLSQQYSNSDDFKLPKEIWKLILLRKRQQLYCKHLHSQKYIHILRYFAEYLDIPISKYITKSELCKLISQQLAWGGNYSPESVEYFKNQEKLKDLYGLAARLGVNTDQNVGKVLDDIGAIFL